MIQIFRRFFAFSGKENRHKFIRSIFLGVLKAIFEAMKIPAIAVTLHGVLSGDLTVQHILLSFGIMLLSVAGNAFANYRSTMLQCEAGYGTCADKRIEIAEHLKYLPMGYFNRNSLGYITSVATNSMEALADVATRVVMMVTQGILTTIFVVLMILLLTCESAASPFGVYCCTLPSTRCSKRNPKRLHRSRIPLTASWWKRCWSMFRALQRLRPTI